MIKKYNILLTLVLFHTLVVFIFCSFYKPKDDPKRKVKIIVIDPGHGGKDPGCNGVSCKEKDVALAVSLKLGKLIEENIKDVKVIFTRKTDVFVELEDRAKIANDNNADLFISIHCNAAGKPVMVKDKKTGKMRPKTFKNSRGKLIVVETTNPEPFGSETYVMGLKNEEGKMKVAQRENSAMLLEDNYETKYQGFDPNSEESYIIMSNYTSSYVIQSAGLALKIQEQYFKKAGRVDKGVHRQSIWVLWRTSMPSVLTEIGYLTNPQEEKFLGSEKGQTYLAACLFRAFRKYKDEQEGVKKVYDDAIENQVPLENENYKIANETEEVKTIDKPINETDVEVKEEKKDKTATNEEKIKEEAEAKLKLIAEQKAKEDKQKEDKLREEAKAKEKMLAEQKVKEEAESKAKADSLAEVQKTLSKAEEQEKKYRQFIALADVNFKNGNYAEALGLYQKASTNKPNDAYASKKVKEVEGLLRPVSVKTNTVSEVKEEPKIKSGIVFKVQFASTDKEVDAKAKYPNVTDIWFYKAGTVYKYTSGNYSNMEEAAKQQAKLKELGYKDCFVAAFKDGVRMDIGEAKRLTGTK
ncbi:MAG: N-acetylmuramoyl-L-alanine amidase [Bacteroidota bacterium]|jgi:N-acetylmuramoyl-L-alanine amidase|nr:N-acetylmuramoyl-L-alanine amidase [Bacteroidota bacterium]